MDTIRRISDLVYELYKVDWMRRISVDRILDALKNYYQETDENMREWYTFEDYLYEVGFDGEIYACYGEFVENEYLDNEYVKTLLDNNELYKEYLCDVRIRV